MAATVHPLPTPDAIRVPLIGWLVAGVGLLAVYVVLQENGALLAGSWETIHELFHDGRHALGVPCH